MRLPLSGGTPHLILRAPEISNFQCARMPSHTCVLSQIAGNHIVFSTFDPATGNQTQIHSIDDPEWFLLNWTLSSDGHTLALAKKHRSPLPADILLLNLEGGEQRSSGPGQLVQHQLSGFCRGWKEHLGECDFSSGRTDVVER